MRRHPFITCLIALLAAACGFGAHAAKRTVCTITVNSADEKEAIRARLPKGQYDFVELVEKGRPDWLRSSCARNVQCDVLVISGHFNAGDTFYSDQLDRHEYLEIDELERAACTASCPLFSHLKEVYLFGCESLNPDAKQYASSYGESGRERMRRIFAGVPAIYGFSSAAPVGPTAAMLLNRYFDGGSAAGIFGTGQPNPRLLQVFSRNSMVKVAGARGTEPLAVERGRICRFFDESQSAASKVQFAHALLRGEAGELRQYFNRIEKLFASMSEAERQQGGFTQALAQISADDAARARYVTALRRSPPALRSRMVAMGATLGWFSEAQQRDEWVAMIGDMMAAGSMGYAEVDLVCSLNEDGRLNEALGRVAAGASRRVADSVVLACLGSRDAHAQMLRALASPDDKDVQIAQVYLRHRPVAEQKELREVARDITRMAGAAAQVRALDTLARLHISDREILDELSRAFAGARSVNVQRAIAEVFIRSDPQALSARSLVATLREHRLKAPGGGHDLIDALIARLQATS